MDVSLVPTRSSETLSKSPTDEARPLSTPSVVVSPSSAPADDPGQQGAGTLARATILAGTSLLMYFLLINV